MAEYVVTGKKGSGKGIVSVGKIQEYLFKGRYIATNHDLFPRWLVGKYEKDCRIIRIPDKPKIQDFRAIGIGNPTVRHDVIEVKDDQGRHLYYDYVAHDYQPDFDENQNGLLVLDELGSWFNARGFADKDRAPVLDWLIHSRKLGWDIIYEIQDLEMIDKQVKLGFAEHVVYCRRTDRLPIPLIGSFIPFKFPKVHLGLVVYGTGQNAPKVDTWLFRGIQLYRAYNTLQRYSDRYPHGGYSYLPPSFFYSESRMKFTIGNLMRLTKIIARKYSRVTAFAVGLVFAFTLSYAFYSPDSSATEVQLDHEVKETDNADKFAMFEGLHISGVVRLPGRTPSFTLSNADNSKTISTDSILSQGYKIQFLNDKHIIVSADGGYREIFAH